MFEIIDNQGTIHSGSEEEMTHAFDVMANPDEYSRKEVLKWGVGWEGDLKLVEIINTIR